MPYIEQSARERLDEHIERLSSKIMIGNVGELNYVITRLVLRFVRGAGKSYSLLSNVVGTLTLARHELVRRVVDPYEDGKIAANGDVREYRDIFDE